MKALLYAVALLCFAGSAFAQGTYLPFGEYLSWGGQVADCYPCGNAGIGDDGDVVCNGSGNTIIWFPNGQLHCFLYTGHNPGTSGYFTIMTNQALQSNGQYQHALCALSLETTAADYQYDYNTADWPPGQQLYLDQYSSNNQWLYFAWDSTWGRALDPYTVYSYIIICPPK